LRRFEQERQALALMDHIHIARVLDAGTTSQGRPYFVMELVKGVPITKYCDESHLPLRERLELFVPVCQAIQHAHQKGIIHRDIKPSNVLVAIQDGKPVPRVIDFGVAKALHQRLTEQSMYTEIGQVVGTLEYMSPEQAELSVLDIDTRADVYALGVLLYELLTGTTPLDRKRLKQAAYAEMLRIIREEEPPKPSTRLTDSKDALASLAAQRRTEPARLTREVRGELDWIVMKCLEKDRTRRYETASGLARDLERHLHDEPVEACPPSASYRFGKLLRKHRAAVLTAAAFVLLLLAGALISSWQAVRATQAEQTANADRDRALTAEHDANVQRDKAVSAEKRARESQADLTAFSEFLVQDILSAARPPDREGGGLGINVTVKTALDAAVPKLRLRFQGKPWAEFLCSHALGKTYDRRGDLEAAEPLLRRAWELCRQYAPADDRRRIIIPNNLSALLAARGKETEATALLEEALKLARASWGPDDPDTLLLQCNLGRVYARQGQGARALPLFEEAHRRVQDSLGDRHELAVVSKNFLATAYLEAGRYDEAVAQ
ncbi:MAG TPA: serine/threonine-protein kinase, partial [Gemmataceae bacterium]|nr:serine/threonine-protein kinase [Gemmataceae bacterium]